MLKALRGYQKKAISRRDFDAVADNEIRRTVHLQEKAGLDIIVDGEHRRESFYAFITDKVAGTQLMSLADMLDYVEDKAEFEEMLRTMDMPASAVKNPTCIGRLSRRETLAVDDLRFLRTTVQKTGEDHPARPLSAHPLDVGRGPDRQGLSAITESWRTISSGSCGKS